MAEEIKTLHEKKLANEHRKTQKDRLLNYLKTGRKINPIISWQQLGIYRLSGVVHELRKDGWQIITETVKVQNQFGEGAVVGQYHMVLQPREDLFENI